MFDETNQRYGRGTVKLDGAWVQAQGERSSWEMREEMLVVGD